MKTAYLLLAVSISITTPAFGEEANPAMARYQWLTALGGDWMLAPAEVQQGKATQHKLVAPLLGTDQVAISFRVIGRGSTVQETLLPGTRKEMVTMYHCQDSGCTQVKATHYCVKQNQPELLADLSGGGNSVKFDCDMGTELCRSGRDHIHVIAHELSEDGNRLKATYSSFKDGKHVKDSVYFFDRRS